MKKLLLFLIFTHLGACKNTSHKKAENITIGLKNKETNLEDKINDSFSKFSALETFLKRDDSSKYVLYSDNINFNQIRVIAITDSVLIFYQQEESRFKITERIPFKTYASSFKVTDLNGDLKDDFIVMSFPDVHGMSIPYVFICDDKNVLHYREDIKLHNIMYDPDTKLVRTYYESCAYCIHSKALYRWENDSLILVERVELDLTKQDQITTTFYRNIDGKQVAYKKVLDEDEYENALFSIDY